MPISHTRRRQKGAEGEAFILIMLQQIMAEEYRARNIPPPELHRGANGRDIRGISFLSPEVKRHEPRDGVAITESEIAAWWEQAKRQASVGQMPVLFWRPNHSPWRVRMIGYLDLARADGSRVNAPVDISIETFQLWFRERVKSSLARAQ